MTSDVIALILARLASPAASFLVVILLARQWGGELLGQYNTVWAWLVILHYLSMLGLTEYTVRELGYDAKRAPECLTHGLLLTTIASCLGSAAMIGSAVLIHAPTGVRHGMIVASLCLPFMACTVFCQAIFTAFRRIRFIALTGIAENGVFVTLAVAIIFSGQGFVRLMWALAVSRAVGAALSLVLVRRELGVARAPLQWSRFRQMLGTVFVFGITGVAFQIYMRADAIILGHLKDMATVGMYTASSKLLEVGTMLPLACYLLNMPVAADAYRHRRASANREIRALGAWSILAVVILSGLGILFAEPVLALVYGRQFAASATVLRILLCVLVLHSVQLILEMGCQAAGYHRWAMYIGLLRAGANVALNFAFIPAFGAIGAALASLGAALSSLAGFCYLAYRKLGVRRAGVSLTASEAL